jgi:hypothetical protein
MAIERLDALAAPPPQPAAEPSPRQTAKLPLASAISAVVAVALVAWLAGRPSSSDEQAPGLTADARAGTNSQAAPALAVTPAVDLAAAVPTVSEAPPAEMITQLVVRTRPEGARVTVDGIGWGTSPVAIRHLPPGDKRIRVTKPGYGSSERVVAVAAGNRESVVIALAPLVADR